MTTSSAMKCCDGNCVRRWPLTYFAIRTHLYLYDKGKGVCVRDVCAIYDNNISPSLLMIIIKIIILYFIQIRHTDAFPPTGTLLVQIINNLPNKNSCGFDGISTIIMKSIKNGILKPLTLIINQIINTGVFPNKLKIAKITPVFKKDDRTLFTNYRPISLLTIFSKVI